MKRYLSVIISIIVVAAIAILILFLIKDRSAGTTLVTSNATTTGALPVTGTQGTNATGTTNGNPVSALGLSPTPSGTPSVTGAGGQMTLQSFGVLSQSPVLDYFVNAQNTITAIEPTGEVIAITNGNTSIINSSTISDVISSNFSYDGEKILVNYGDPSNPQSGIYNLATNAWTALPQGMMSPQWSPAGNYQIAYLVTTNSGKLALATIDAANLKASPVVLLTLNAQDLTLQWPMKNEFILSDKPSAENLGSVLSFNSLTGALDPILYQVSGGESNWSHSAAFPSGLLFSDIASGQAQLQFDSLSSGNSAPETLSFLTLPSKCAFDPELMPAATSTATTTTPAAQKNVATSTPYLALYCGIPRASSGFSSANLPNAYNMMELFTSDDIYKINTATGAEQVLWNDPTQNMDTSDVKFFNNALFFVNRYDQKLYGLTFSD
jgi:hypothetical protein